MSKQFELSNPDNVVEGFMGCTKEEIEGFETEGVYFHQKLDDLNRKITTLGKKAFYNLVECIDNSEVEFANMCELKNRIKYSMEDMFSNILNRVMCEAVIREMKKHNEQ